MRRMTWSAMGETERDALCRRGLDAIFDPALRESIGRIIEDVRVNGDEAVCRALRDHDRIDVTPDQLRVTEDELAAATVSPAVDAAIDDAIAHLTRFNEHLIDRADNWMFESEPGLYVGEKVTP